MKPLVSVIMPTYNHAKFIGRAIASVLNQTYPNFELIIIDNYSEDDTEKIVVSYVDARIIYLKFRNNGVIAAGRNNGIKHANGEYIAFLDSDDWWYSNKLEIVEKYLHKADIVYHDLDTHTEKGKRFRKPTQGRHLKRPVFVDLMTKGNAIANSSVVVRKSIIEQVGGLCEDKSLISKEDFDLWLRISRITEEFVFIRKSLGAYWCDGGNMSKSSEQQIQRLKKRHDKFIEFLIDKDRELAERLVNYSTGRTYAKLDLTNKAIESFKISARSQDPLIKLKSIISIILISTSCWLKSNRSG
jgi:glycosyltransferase involved in cell wall biosynthesis